MPTDKQLELLGSLLACVEGRPTAHQDSLLLLALPLLGLRPSGSPLGAPLSLPALTDKPHVAKLLSTVMLDVLLLPYASTAPPPTPEAGGGAEAPWVAPGGMSATTYRRVTQDGGFTPQQLEELKLGIVKFLATGIYPIQDVLLHLIVAAADTRFSIANLADLELKKSVSGVDWSSVPLAQQLYRLYLGTASTAGNSTQNRNSENLRQAANTRIRLKLLHYMCKLTGPGFIVPACVQVFYNIHISIRMSSRKWSKRYVLDFNRRLPC